MKMVPRIEQWLDDVEHRLEAQRAPRKVVLQLTVYDTHGDDKEKALARLAANYPEEYAGLTVQDLPWADDDRAPLKEKAIAEHLAAHPEDAGCDFQWSIWVIATWGALEALAWDALDALAVSEVPAAGTASEASAAVVAASETLDPNEPVSARASNVVSMRDRPWSGRVRKNSWLTM
jgi:hypothetical protein